MDDPDRSDPHSIKTNLSETPKSSLGRFLANTATITVSSFASSGPTTVQLYGLDDGAPKPAQLHSFYKKVLVWLLVFGACCVVARVSLAFIFPEPTPTQENAMSLLTHLATGIAGLVIGLYGGKQI
jgi:hypothetical protein